MFGTGYINIDLKKNGGLLIYLGEKEIGVCGILKRHICRTHGHARPNS